MALLVSRSGDLTRYKGQTDEMIQLTSCYSWGHFVELCWAIHHVGM